MTERQYLDYIQDIVESVNDIESFVSNMLQRPLEWTRLCS